MSSELLPSVALSYTIEAWSSYSSGYIPENITVDSPLDQNSRWSGQSRGMKKPWITLKLSSPSIVKSITFGKYHKPHPCNVREFHVYGGMTLDNMTEILHDGLRNDSVPQIFPTIYRNAHRIPFPCRYVKIVMINAHNPSYNTSLWFVQLEGIDGPDVVQHVAAKYTEYRQAVATRLMLKHLRQKGHFGAYRHFIASTSVQLEHPTVSQLYNNLVLSGNWDIVEELVHQAGQERLFDEYVHESPPTPSWHRILDTNADGDVPSRRGGHQLCLDSAKGLIFLFGGWDGTSNLADFWVYSIAGRGWRIISNDTSKDGGPCGRSCHKMAFDPRTGYLYVLGLFEQPLRTDTVGSTAEPDLPSDFFRYSTRGLESGSGRWQLLSKDTAAEGGPSLLYDHQLALVANERYLYVFGGRVVDKKADPPRYSGMYRYHLDTRNWELLFDVDMVLPTQSLFIPSRAGHSMLLEPNSESLYIFAGQRSDAYLSDMYKYVPSTSDVYEISSNFTTNGGPRGCFTQRSAIDPEYKEIYMMSGLSGDSLGIQESIRSSFWVYRYKTRRWLLAQHPPLAGDPPEEDAEDPREPVARYAHQMVYDDSSKNFYLFGGNAGGDRRLNDFWSMNLKRMSPLEICRRANFQIRKQRFAEMCEDAAPLKALNYLSNDVSAVVDHSNAEESETYRSLLAPLITRLSSEPVSTPATTTSPPRDSHTVNPLRLDEDADMLSASRPSSPFKPPSPEMIALPGCGERLSRKRFTQRTLLFESLLMFVSPEHKQPDTDILDLVKVDSEAY